jgi:hypothetical protein
MPNTARLAPAAFLPLARVPPRPVFAREERGRSSSKSVSGFAVLLLLCLILYAPGLASIPPVDRDEARFAQATRQMLETGDFIRIRFQEEPRNKKAIGIHWLQAAMVTLFSTPGSTAIWPYRLPSALGATIAVLLTSVLCATLLSSRRAGSIAGVTTASALALVVEAHLAKTDAALLAAGSRASSSCSALRAGWRPQPPGIGSSQARAWPWSVIGKTWRSENPWRRAG